jgi:type VI secretion system secreted protein Hcp
MGGWIKISDIKGDSQDPGHAGWIQVESMSWGAVTRRGGSSAGGRSERPAMSEITITKKTDSSSPVLMRASVKGDIFDEVTLDMTDASGRNYVSFQFHNVVVSHVSQSSGAAIGPIETVTLNFAGAAATQGGSSPSTGATTAFSSATTAIAKAIGNAIAHVARGG